MLVPWRVNSMLQVVEKSGDLMGNLRGSFETRGIEKVGAQIIQ